MFLLFYLCKVNLFLKTQNFSNDWQSFIVSFEVASSLFWSTGLV